MADVVDVLIYMQTDKKIKRIETDKTYKKQIETDEKIIKQMM